MQVTVTMVLKGIVQIDLISTDEVKLKKGELL